LDTIHSETRSIAIVGGGFSGTMAAVNLARFSQRPLRVVLINAKRPFGRGTAYGTSRREHLLNVAARNMSAFPDHPNHFFNWLRSRSEFNAVADNELREMFVPRMVYGDYIRSLAESHLRPVHTRFNVQFELIEDEAVDLIYKDSSNIQIFLSQHDPVMANVVLLATGNQPPADLPTEAAVKFDQRYCSDPWASSFIDRLPPHGSEIVILGTGLTMVDVIMTLESVGWQGRVTAISRNGMLPRSHFRGIAYPDYLPPGAESLGLAKLVELVEEHCQRLTRMSQNGAIAVDRLRPHTQTLWKAMSIEDKKAFLKTYAARWNVTRHRIAQLIHNTMTDRLDRGMLRVIPGKIESLATTDKAIEVRYRNQQGKELVLPGDFVVNCTGPESKFSNSILPLFHNLLERGLACADDLDMGIRVDEDFAVLDKNLERVENLFAIGPILKGTLWETVAVPELRGQAMRVAEVMLDLMPTSLQQENVIEYCI
jgi:uncharacterized NAD(P)/FAD-binding protein YdhS